MHHVSFSTALLCAAALLGSALPAAAQDRIYRCGNEYTNNAAQAQSRGCKLVEGANVTVVPGTRPSPSEALRPPAAPTAAAPSAAPRVDTNDQRARDADARSILAAELRRAESRQAELLKEYNNGEPERQGGERNYQKYLDRVEAMKASIARNESDIAGIRRELERLK